MGEIKSAYEKALERVRELGEESAEERQRREQSALASQGEDLANRYLNILSYGPEDLKRDLDRLSAEARATVIAAVLGRLVQKATISSDNQRLLDGIKALGENGPGGLAQALADLCRRYQQHREERQAELGLELERETREELEALGISGDAIEVDIESSSGWQEALGQIESEFEAKKQRLLASYGRA